MLGSAVSTRGARVGPQGLASIGQVLSLDCMFNFVILESCLVLAALHRTLRVHSLMESGWIALLGFFLFDPTVAYTTNFPYARKPARGNAGCLHVIKMNIHGARRSDQ